MITKEKRNLLATKAHTAHKYGSNKSDQATKHIIGNLRSTGKLHQTLMTFSIQCAYNQGLFCFANSSTAWTKSCHLSFSHTFCTFGTSTFLKISQRRSRLYLHNVHTGFKNKHTSNCVRQKRPCGEHLVRVLLMDFLKNSVSVSTVLLSF